MKVVVKIDFNILEKKCQFSINTTLGCGDAAMGIR